MEESSKRFFDRLESKQFTTNLIVLLAVPLFLVVFIALIIVGWDDKAELLDKIWNLSYMLIGLIIGFIGAKKVRSND